MGHPNMTLFFASPDEESRVRPNDRSPEGFMCTPPKVASASGNCATPSFGCPVTPEERCEDAQLCEIPTLARRLTNSTQHFTYGAVERIGSKVRMEDVLCVASWQEMEAAMVFDGHRSNAVSCFAASELPLLLEQEFHSAPGDAHHPELALQHAFRACHEAARGKKLPGGTTALVVLHTGTQLLCANAGDTRAVACVKGAAVRVSVDHHADTIEEEKRIVAAGGRVEFGRLEGDLQVCRGFGDFELEPGLTCAPQIAELCIQDTDFIICASDGLWEKVSDEEAVEIVMEGMTLGRDLETCADDLAALARERRGTDDIAIILLSGFAARGR